MRSTADAFGQIINCRQLDLQIRFYGLEHPQVDELARKYYHHVSEMFASNCILDWRFRNRVINDFENSLNNWKNSYGLYSMTLQGDFISESVYNKTTLRTHAKRLQYDNIFNQGIAPGFCATDYQAYRKNKLEPFENDPHQFVSALYKLFMLNHTETMNQYHEHDINGFFRVSCFEQNTDFLFGKLYLSIPVFCLGHALDEFALSLVVFAKKCAESFKNINASVNLSTKSSGGEYDVYFGGLKEDDEKIYKEWQNIAHSLYHFEVGWSNILSPATRSLEDNLNKTFELSKKGIRVEECANGCLIVQCNTPISINTQMDLQEIKRMIYGTLFPGKADFLYSFGFRRYWENISVLEQEIIPLGTAKIRFTHNSRLNVQFLEENTGFCIDELSKCLRVK